MPTTQGIRTRTWNAPDLGVTITGPSPENMRRACMEFAGTGQANGGTQQPGRHLSPAARKKIADAQKRRREKERAAPQTGNGEGADAVATATTGENGGGGTSPKKGLKRAAKAAGATQ